MFVYLKINVFNIKSQVPYFIAKLYYINHLK